MPNKKQKKKSILSNLFDKLDKKLVEKSKKKQCSCSCSDTGKDEKCCK